MGLCLSGGTTAPAILVPSKAENTGVWSPLAVLRYRNALNILELNDLGAHGSLSINTAGMLAAGSLPLWPFGRCTCFSFACPIGIDWPQVAKQSRAAEGNKAGVDSPPMRRVPCPRLWDLVSMAGGGWRLLPLSGQISLSLQHLCQ